MGIPYMFLHHIWRHSGYIFCVCDEGGRRLTSRGRVVLCYLTVGSAATLIKWVWRQQHRVSGAESLTARHVTQSVALVKPLLFTTCHGIATEKLTVNLKQSCKTRKALRTIALNLENVYKTRRELRTIYDANRLG